MSLADANTLHAEGSENGRIWPGIHLIAIVALIFRIAVALYSERISYPDELFQYLEQAHRFVYGFGFETWEYRYGIRNWLLPGFLSCLLGLLSCLGLNEPATYIPVIKLIMAVCSVSVVYASYFLGRTLFSHNTATLAAVLAAFWYEPLYYSVVATPEVLSSYSLLVAAALVICGRSESAYSSLFVSLLVGVAVALRIHYFPSAVLIIAYAFYIQRARRWLLLVAPGSLVLLFAGWLDQLQWGCFFFSFYNSFFFNIIHGVSNVFGKEPWYWYGLSLGFYSGGLLPLAFIYALVDWRRSWKLLLLALSVIGPHSLIPHKEHRFIFLASLVILMFTADLVASSIARVTNPARRRLLTAFALIVLAGGSIAGSYWRGLLTRDGRLLSLLDLAHQDDVVSVLDAAGPWYATGGFYYLHKDIPYYFPGQTDGLSSDELKSHVSHILVTDSAAEPEGFTVSGRHGGVKILKQLSPPMEFLRLPADGRKPIQWEIEDSIPTNIRARF